VSESRWLDLSPAEQEDEETGPPEYEISTYPTDFTLQVLHQQWQEGAIVVPPFQRQFVWKQPQASRLIESFLLGLPVPPVYFYTERGTDRFLVIDGQQRLKSIAYFFEGFFGEESAGRRPVFRLTGLHEKSRFLNKTLSELEESDPASTRRLNHAVLRAFVVKQLDPKDDTSIFHIFERLNTGGTRLVGQEVRNAIYGGPLNDSLKRLNRYPDWRAIVGRVSPDKHMRDEELILRFLALHENLSGYQKPLGDFLSRFMQRQRNASPAVIRRYEELFRQTVSRTRDALGPRPFHLRAGLNAAVYDATLVAMSSESPTVPDIRAAFFELTRSTEFFDLTSYATTDTDSVKRRIELARTRLLE
jgi:hypothetical protein